MPKTCSSHTRKSLAKELSRALSTISMWVREDLPHEGTVLSTDAVEYIKARARTSPRRGSPKSKTKVKNTVKTSVKKPYKKYFFTDYPDDRSIDSWVTESELQRLIYSGEIESYEDMYIHEVVSTRIVKVIQRKVEVTFEDDI